MEYLTFKNGRKIPALGMGLLLRVEGSYALELEKVIHAALETGYRHFDTATQYRGSEAVLGKVLKEWLDAGKVKREELFITTKLPPHGNHPDRVENFLKLSLAALQLDYVDLYLIHNPIGFKYVSDDEFMPKDENGELALDLNTDLVAIWGAMEAQVAAGRAISIGVSNFNPDQLERIVKVAKVWPANNQVEMNVYFQQKELRELCGRLGITIVAYGALGSPGRTVFYAKLGMQGLQVPLILEDPVVIEIAKKYGKAPGQVLLRFLVQLGVAPIATSTNPTRLRQNLDVFDFKISDSDMKTLVGLDKGEDARSFTMDVWKGVEKHPEYPFPRT